MNELPPSVKKRRKPVKVAKTAAVAAQPIAVGGSEVLPDVKQVALETETETGKPKGKRVKPPKADKPKKLVKPPKPPKEKKVKPPRVRRTTNPELAEIQRQILKEALESSSFEELEVVTGQNANRLKNLYYKRSDKPLTPEEVSLITGVIQSSKHDRKRNDLLTSLDGQGMAEILLDWATRLDVAPDDYETIGYLLGVSSYTVSLWSEGKCKPQDINMMRYQMVVELLERQLQMAKERLRIPDSLKD